MFKLLSLRRRAEKANVEPPKEKQTAQGKDGGEQVVSVLNELVEQQGASTSVLVRSVLKATISTAEQIIDSIKVRAEEEARKEAERIIAQARDEAEKIKKGISSAAEEKKENIASVAEAPVEEAVEESIQLKEEAEAGEEEVPTQLQEGPVDSGIEATVLSEAESSVSEPVAEAEAAASPAEEKTAERQEAEITLTKKEREMAYTGDVEISIGVPVEPSIVYKLYNYLQTTPEIKFVRTQGSWNKGTSIIITLDKPIPLIKELSSKITEAAVLPVPPDKDSIVGDRRGLKKISISPKGQ